MTDQNSQNELNRLRGRLEEAPTLRDGKKAKKEIKVRRSPWVLRSLILVLAFLFATELFAIGQYRKEAQRIIVNNPPVVKSYPAPEVSAVLSPPPIEGVSEDYSQPEPAPYPLPAELEGIEFPVIEE